MSIHAGKGERQVITFLLRFVFGDTFAEHAYFYKKPDAKKFIACLLHVASYGRVSKHADTSKLFVKNIRKKTYRVDEIEMYRLGCTKAQLYETLRRTPGAKAAHRHPDAAPLLIVPAPDDLGDAPAPLPPTLFDDSMSSMFGMFGDRCRPNFEDAWKTEIDAVGGANDLLDVDLDDMVAPSLETFDQRSEAKVAVEEMRIVERELETVANHVRGLVSRGILALSDDWKDLTETLDVMRQKVRTRRVAAEV